MLIWFLFTYTPVPGIPVLFCPPSTSMHRAPYMGRFRICSPEPSAGGPPTPEEQRTSVRCRLRSCLRTPLLLLLPLHVTLFPQVPVWHAGTQRRSPAFIARLTSFPSQFLQFETTRGRAEGLTAHLGPGCQEHGCHHLVSLSERGWS